MVLLYLRPGCLVMQNSFQLSETLFFPHHHHHHRPGAEKINPRPPTRMMISCLCSLRKQQSEKNTHFLPWLTAARIFRLKRGTMCHIKTDRSGTCGVGGHPSLISVQRFVSLSAAAPVAPCPLSPQIHTQTHTHTHTDKQTHTHTHTHTCTHREERTHTAFLSVSPSSSGDCSRQILKGVILYHQV